jgi:hypothetical protein
MAEDRQRTKKTARRRERTFRREADRSQLLERGESPGEPVGSFAGSDTQFTTEGGPGTNTPNRWGGWLRPDRNSPPNPRHANTGGDAGYSTLGGGTYYGEGDPDDAPGYGDWGRNATGAGGGALGREGFGYPGERTWGESERARERAAEAPPRRGPHAGRGPRNYRRSDESIREEICEDLTAHPDIDASEIEVSVEGGEVMLTGTVDDRDARWLAEELAEEVSGVRAVYNELRVAASR